MEIKPAEFGFSTADAEDVRLQFNGLDLHLQFKDWKEQLQEWTFKNAAAYRWGQTTEVDLPQDDCTFEVIGSVWLANETREAGLKGTTGFAHFVLSFNACGILEVIASRQT